MLVVLKSTLDRIIRELTFPVQPSVVKLEMDLVVSRSNYFLLVLLTSKYRGSPVNLKIH